MGRKSKLVSVFDNLRKRGWEPGRAAGWSPVLTEANYEVLCGAQMKAENLPLAAVAVELLCKHQPDTVRGVMYSVVSAGWLPDTGKQCYGRIQRLLNALRKKGVIPFQWVVDNVRSTIKPSSWSGLADFADTVAEAYRKDFWASLDDYVVVVVEKDTVAGRVEPVTREYDVPLHPLRGYSSTSFAWGIARQWREIDKPITVYYVGDHDPSGRDIERSVIASLREYGGRDFAWRRLAVEPGHFEEFDIIPLAPKKKDRRYQKFVDAYGPRCAEVEAIPASDLRRMVRSAIESHIPAEQWDRLKEIEREEKAKWDEVMGKLRGAA